MSTERHKPLTRTLRFRLMVWNAFVVLLTGMVTLIGLREGVRLTLTGELDQLLHEDLEEIELSLGEFGGAKSELLREQLERKAQGHAGHKWFVQLLGEQNELLYASSTAPPREKLAPGVASSTPRTLGMWRVCAKHVALERPVTVRVGASLEMIRQDIARLDRLVAIAAGAILLTAPLCGYWLAGRATKPLAQIINTMAQLRPSQLNERLEVRGSGDELDRLSVTFNRLLDRIGAYLQERRDFLANAAHELRTPLAAIRSGVEVALAANRSRAEYEELLGEIIEESMSLELLVNQLLLLTETETERLKIRKERVRFDALVERAVDMFGGVAEFRNIQLVCPGLPIVEVEGNGQHLRQVIYNLLDNAIKFTPGGGRVRVDLKADATAGQMLFRVVDTGIGIPPNDLPHVFDRFFRGDRARNRASESRGTGLGLSICHAIVRAHEGTITADSVPGAGATFVVSLPLPPADGSRRFEKSDHQDERHGHEDARHEPVPSKTLAKQPR